MYSYWRPYWEWKERERLPSCTKIAFSGGACQGKRTVQNFWVITRFHYEHWNFFIKLSCFHFFHTMKIWWICGGFLSQVFVVAAISVPTPLEYIIVSQSGNILCFQECEWANFCVIFEISSSNVMSNPDQCIFISNLLWWGSVLEQKTEAFCLFGKSGAMIASQHSLRRANGKFEVLCLQSALKSHVFKNLMRSQSRYLIGNCEL